MRRLEELHNKVKNHPFRINGSAKYSFCALIEDMIKEYEKNARKRNYDRKDLKEFIDSFTRINEEIKYDVDSLAPIDIEFCITCVHNLINKKDNYGKRVKTFCVRCGVEFVTYYNDDICDLCLKGA